MLAGALFYASSQAQEIDGETAWQSEVSSDGIEATARHETAAVAVGDRLFLLGGRGNKPTDVYDTVTREWVVGDDTDRAPLELHHFQPVAIGTDIYVLGALTGRVSFPNEESLADIYVFDTIESTWTSVGEVPEDRRRGSTAAVLRDGKIYVLGGNTKGHNGGAVPWLDEYDPQTGEWRELADAPSSRDHFAAAVINDKLVAAGGRQSFNDGDSGVFANEVAPTDVYDFATNTWSEGSDIPTLRAGTMVASAGNELLVAGGETAATDQALATVEAYNVTENTWRSLQNMLEGRHSGGSAVVGKTWHVVAGDLRRGGAVEFETGNQETLALPGNPDTDNDGLDDVDELAIHSTDPNDPDSDDDGLNDGLEVELGSDPNDSDSDDDGLSDGDEYNVHQSSPLLTDTDDDRLSDGDEVEIGSDPNNPDTDNDGLSDGDEVRRSLSPTKADTDDDGLNDGAEISAGTDPLDSDTDKDGLLDGEDPDPLVAETDGGEGGTGGEGTTGEVETTGEEVGTSEEETTGEEGTITEEGADTGRRSSSSGLGYPAIWLLMSLLFSCVWRGASARRE